MDTTLTQIEHLLMLLEEREETIEHLTSQVLATLKPTLLDVLSELFGMSDTNIEWLDVQLIDTVLLIICAVNYNADGATPYLKKLFATSDPVDSMDENIKMIRIGIPVALAFGPRRDIIKFLHDTVDGAIIEKIETTVENTREISDNNSFDTSKLSSEQLEQLSLFTHQGKGAKH